MSLKIIGGSTLKATYHFHWSVHVNHDPVYQVSLSYRFRDMKRRKMACPWNPG